MAIFKQALRDFFTAKPQRIAKGLKIEVKTGISGDDPTRKP
jgi:hypothetical protein